MPYKIEKFNIDDPFLDRRIKILPCQKEMLLYWWAEGKTARFLARMFKVSRQHVESIVKNKPRKVTHKYNREVAVRAVKRNRKYKDSMLHEVLTGKKKKRKTKWDPEKKKAYILSRSTTTTGQE